MGTPLTISEVGRGFGMTPETQDLGIQSLGAYDKSTGWNLKSATVLEKVETAINEKPPELLDINIELENRHMGEWTLGVLQKQLERKGWCVLVSPVELDMRALPERAVRSPDGRRELRTNLPALQAMREDIWTLDRAETLVRALSVQRGIDVLPVLEQEQAAGAAGGGRVCVPAHM